MQIPVVFCADKNFMIPLQVALESLMCNKKMSNDQLKEKAGFSTNIITRLKRNEYVSIESIERICRVLECGVDDILEFVPGEKEGKEA